MAHPFLFKASSQIHGRGIFTKRDIEKGYTFYEIPFRFVLFGPAPRCAYIGNDTWISDKDVLNYINHSCNPNTFFHIRLQTNSCLSALRPIRAGEEITVDYDKTEIGGNRVPCNCKSPNCRGYFMRRV